MARRKRPSPTAAAPSKEALEAVRRDPVVLLDILPGANELDPDLLDELVGQVNRLYITRSIGTARDVAEHVVGALALGDLQDFLAVARSHKTWRALQQRKDLVMSYSQIWSSIGVLDQLRKLPKDIGDALPISHHKRLLVVKDEPTLVALAEAAVVRKLTAEELSAEIHAQGAAAPKGNRGRKRLPAVVKSVRAAAKTLVDFEPDPVTDASLDEDDLDDLLAALDQHGLAIQRVREHLTALRGART